MGCRPARRGATSGHRLKDLGRPEHVFQLCHADLPDDFPALAGLDASPNNLPAQLTTFIGRERELADAGALLDEHRLVTLTGAGGCGKTRLALQLAAERVDRHPGGVWYVELASLAGSGTVARQVADVLGVHEDAEQAVARRRSRIASATSRCCWCSTTANTCSTNAPRSSTR